MKKIFTSTSVGRWIYPLLCLAVVAITVGSVWAYKQTANNLADSLETPIVTPDIDYSAVDKLMENVQKNPAPVAAPEAEDIKEALEEVFYEKAIYMPVANTNVIGEFSFGELVKSPSGVWKTHDGVDLAAELGSPVKAMTSGTVTRVYKDQLWGNCVEIDHGDALTGIYCGLEDDIKVAPDMVVNAGQIIGTVGKTDIESAMDDHLHFGLKHGDKWIDPVSYIEPYK